MSVGISAFAHDRKTGTRVTLGRRSLHNWTGSISKLLSGSGKGQHKTMVPETEKIRFPRSPSGDNFLTVKWGGGAQVEHDAPVDLGRRDQVLELLRRLKSVRQVVTEEGAVQRGSPELCVAGGMGCTCIG